MDGAAASEDTLHMVRMIPLRKIVPDAACRGSTSPQEVRNAQTFNTSIDRIYSKHRDPAPTLSKAISCKLSKGYIADVYLRCWMKLALDTVLTKSPNFMNPGLSSVHTSDELGSVFIPTTRIGIPTDGSNWLLTDHCIG